MLLRELGAATGCEFRIRRVLRARLLKVFELAQAHLLLRGVRVTVARKAMAMSSSS